MAESCGILNQSDKATIENTSLGTEGLGDMIEELAMVAKNSTTGQNNEMAGGGWEDWIPSMRTLKLNACKITAIATFTTVLFVFYKDFGPVIVIQKSITFTYSSLHYILSFVFGDGTSYAMGAMIVMLMTYLKYSDAKTRIKIGKFLMNNCFQYVKFCASFVIKAINKILQIEEVRVKLRALYGTNFDVSIPYIIAHFNKTVIVFLADKFCEFYNRENPEPIQKEEAIIDALKEEELTTEEELEVKQIVDDLIIEEEESVAAIETGGRRRRLKKKSCKKKRKSNRRRKTNRRRRRRTR